MDDLEKEVYFRQTSFRIFKITSFFMVKFAVIVLVSLAVLYITPRVFPVSEESLIDQLVSIPAILVLTGVALFYVWIRKLIGRRIGS